MLDKNQSLFAYACDFSPRAIEFVKVNISKSKLKSKSNEKITWKKLNRNMNNLIMRDVVHLFVI